METTGVIAARARALLADRRVVDLAVVLSCLVLTALAVKGRWSALPREAVAVAGVVGSVAQSWRRRRPLAAGVAGAVTYLVSANPGPLLVGVYSGAVYGPRRRAGALAGLGWLALVGRAWWDAGRTTLTEAAGFALLVGLAVGVAVHTRTRDLLMASLRERAEHAEAERQLREERARAAERTRIAREMHDVLAHKVSLIALHAGALQLHSTGGPERVQQGVELIRTTAREALVELGDVLGVLTGEPEEPAAGSAWFPDLTSLVEAARAAGQEVDLRQDVVDLPSVTARVVQRVVQEGLTNARKHAPGARTRVRVTLGEDRRVIVTVCNPAAARAPLDLPGSGAGLVGLAERLRLVGGTFQSGPGGRDDAWQVRAAVPWLDQRVEETSREVSR